MSSLETAQEGGAQNNDNESIRTSLTPLFRSCFGRSDSLPPLPTLRTPFVVVAAAPPSKGSEGVAEASFGRTSTTTIMAEPPTPRILVEGQRRSSSFDRPQQQYQGVLWKRRDVFKNRWRPRWFVLQPGQGILTYYLLTGDGAGAAATTMPPESTDADAGSLESPFSAPASDDLRPSRDRATSWDSRASDNPVHYDVVPRGTIYLLGCTVKANPLLTKVSEHLFAFTIIPPSTTEPHIHLAAQTPELRDRWIRSIAAICHCDTDNGDEGAEDLVVASSPLSTTLDHRRSSSSSMPSPSVSTSRSLHPTTIPEHAPLVASPPRRGVPPPTRASSLPAASTRSRPHAPVPLPTPPYSHSFSSLPGQPSPAREAAAERPNFRDWQSLGPIDLLYENLPDSLVKRLQDVLQTTLVELDDPRNSDTTTPDPTLYKVLYRHEGTTAYRRRRSASDRLDSTAYVKVVATLPHPPRQIFEALVDRTRTCDAEHNHLLDCCRVQELNAHTFVDYLAYPGVWPAAPRDFVVATHWQVVGQDKEDDINNNNNSEVPKSIVLISLSCPEADRVWESHSGSSAPSSPGPSLSRTASRNTSRVRGTVHLCANLIQPLPTPLSIAPGRGDNDASMNQCLWTRIVSIDLGGGEEVSPQLVNAVMHQRAKFPLRLSTYLRQFGPTPEPRHRGPLTNESLHRSIVGKLEETRRSVRDRRRIGSQHETPRDSPVIPDDDASADDGAIENPDFLLPPLDQQALVLLAPLLLYQFLVLVKAPSPAVAFLGGVFWAVRQVVLLHIGPTLPDAGPTLLGPVTCRFRIDLKGVLRFIANKKEEREELKRGTADITVLHIVACAVATALKKCDALQVRRVSIPWLGIHRTVPCAAADPVSVSFLVNSETGSQIITLQQVDTYNVQRVADEMKAAADHPDGGAASVGQCLIVAAPNYDHTEMETDVVPRHPNVRVVCTVGGVHLDRNAPQLARSSGTVRPPGPRPFLSLSLTVTNTDYTACTRLAEDVQTLLQFPEMCDDSS